ncbi:hypothetical protein F4778DRAFT_16744 [Xylariomycetidae sp. FL2044]|nr:hypothetical protein F4778DRAFT_16744 [Xylariomycetidae sp. FL2044]
MGMATATYSPAAAHYLPRRDSSPRAPRNPEKRRPRLLRASATEPYITTSNACNGVLTAPNTSRRATELLSRVAIVSSSNASSSPPSSTRSFIGFESAGAVADRRDHRLASEPIHNPHSACYFSFPSFDTWEEEEMVAAQQDGEKTVERAA